MDRMTRRLLVPLIALVPWAGTYSLRVRQDGTEGPEVRYRRDAEGGITVTGELLMFASGGEA